jgi:hypothetical protein
MPGCLRANANLVSRAYWSRKQFGIGYSSGVQQPGRATTVLISQPHTLGAALLDRKQGLAVSLHPKVRNCLAITTSLEYLPSRSGWGRSPCDRDGPRRRGISARLWTDQLDGLGLGRRGRRRATGRRSRIKLLVTRQGARQFCGVVTAPAEDVYHVLVHSRKPARAGASSSRVAEAPLDAACGGNRIRAAHVHQSRGAVVRDRDGEASGRPRRPLPALPVWIAERGRRRGSVGTRAPAGAIAEAGRTR